MSKVPKCFKCGRPLPNDELPYYTYCSGTKEFIWATTVVRCHILDKIVCVGCYHKFWDYVIETMPILNKEDVSTEDVPREVIRKWFGPKRMSFKETFVFR
jgi:hypothetical protein